MIKDLRKKRSGSSEQSETMPGPLPPCFSEVLKNKALISSRVEVIERKEVREGAENGAEIRSVILGRLQAEPAPKIGRSNFQRATQSGPAALPATSERIVSRV